MADAYERDHMPGIGEVLFRHKATAPRWAIAISAGLPAAILAALGAGMGLLGEPWLGLGLLAGAAVYGALMVAVSVTFGTARFAVSEGEVHVQLGFAGPRVPIADILSVRLGPTGRNGYSMGVRKNLDGTTIISALGDNHRAVHLERRGAPPLVLVTTESDALLQAIEEAMRRHARTAPRVRVELAAGALDEGDRAEPGAPEARTRRA